MFRISNFECYPPPPNRFRPFFRRIILCLAVTILLTVALTVSCKSGGDDDSDKDKDKDKEQVTALIDSGIKSLKDGDYDAAIKSFEDAYAKNPNDPEAIVYSTLGKLASIAVSPQVKEMMANRLGIKNYPGTINALVSPNWLESYEDERLMWGYNEGDSWVIWHGEYDDWFFDINEITPRKSGYYKYEQNQWRLILGETTKRPGGDFLYSYQDESGRYVEWRDNEWIQEYNENNGGDPITDGAGYYYYDNNDYQYKFVSSEEKLSGLNSYEDDDPYCYWSWRDFDYSNEYYTYTGFTTPGYYRQLLVYTLVSETPQYEYRTAKLPGLNVPEWFAETDLYKDSFTETQLKSTMTYNWLMLTNLIDKNTAGLNNLLDDLLSSVLGSEFEAAYARAATLTGTVTVSASTLSDFGMDEILEGGDIEIGGAEMNLLFAAMRFLKGSIEWIASYDWNTNLNFLKNGGLWDDFENTELIPENLPLRNNFLNDRGNGMMAKSKADFLKAIDDSIAAYDLWTGANSYLPSGYKDTLNDFKWLKDGFVQLKAAITDGDVFYVTDSYGSDTYDNSETNAFFGLHMGKFFTAGFLSLDKLIETENVAEKGKAPVLYGDDDPEVKITNISDFDNYDWIGIKVLSASISEIIVYGMDMEDMCMWILPPEYAKILWGWYHE